MTVLAAELGMAQRRVRQEALIARPEPRAAASLSRIAALVDWTEIDRHLNGISVAPMGEHGWPPLALFRGLLLATWHDLSNVRLGEALNDRASFRRLCGFAAHDPTPERTAFFRLRRELVHRSLAYCSKPSRANPRSRASSCAPTRWSMPR